MGFDEGPQPFTPPPQPAPSAAMANLRQFVPKLTPKGTRLWASTLMLVAALLLAVSLGVSWWGASASGGGHATVLGFLPGASYQLEAGANSSTQSYVAAGLVHVGQLYEAILAVGVLAVLVGLATSLLSYLGALGVFRTRRMLPFTLLFGFVSLVLTAALPAMAAAGQPGAFSADSTDGFGGSGCGNSPNPCTSFWGSLKAGGITVSWGADVGWYLAIVAAVLLVLALLGWWMTRRAGYARHEVMGSGASMPSPPSA
jgi:hypothetical protein